MDSIETRAVSFNHLKRTKIIATIGPATDSYETIIKLINSGVNGLRLNFSHGNYEERVRQIQWIRKASKELGKPVAIIQDLHGPKMQLGDFEDTVHVRTGQKLQFKFQADYEKTGILPVQFDFSKRVKRGERLSLFDGRVRTVITSVKEGIVHVRAENSGMLIKKKGINLPDTNFGGDIITEKDRLDLAFGAKQDFDYVALSFIQTADDVREFRRILKRLNSKALVISKIETAAAVENLYDIIKESDAVMVARGDLAIETSPESVPVVQRKIIGLGIRYAKPVIVATQMLASMTETPEPTRAEVSDIATAVILGADCVMLSEETAMGHYPIEAVKVMKRVILYTEEHNPIEIAYSGLPKREVTKQIAISYALIKLAEALDVTAIVAETLSGATALQIASLRPDIPIIAVTSRPMTAHQLAIVYAVRSYIRPVDKQAASKLTDWLRQNKALKKGNTVVMATGRYPGVMGTTDTIKVRLLE